MNWSVFLGTFLGTGLGFGLGFAICYSIDKYGEYKKNLNRNIKK